MANQPAPRPSHNLLIRLWPWLVVLVVLVFVGFIRVRLLEMPLERDEGEYAYAGQLILQGIPPYELAYNMKLPGTYFAYAVGMAVFGQTIAGVHLTLIVANSLTIILMFLLGRKLFGVTAGLVTCASYAVMSISPAVAGLAAHATHFVVLFAILGVLLLLKASETNRCNTLFLSGLVFGLAFLMKQPGVFFGVFGWVFLVWQAGRNADLFSGVFAKRAFVFGLGMILPFGLTCLALALAGVYPQFWFWTFTYARSYANSMPWPEGIQVLRSFYCNNFALLSGFWLMAAMGLPLAFFGRSTRNYAAFTVVFLLCSFFGTAVGFYFRPHYFILMLPAFALVQGMAVVSLQKVMGFGAMKNVLMSLPVIFFAAGLSWAVFYYGLIFFQLTPAAVCRNLYAWNPFVESPAVARYLREHTPKEARIAVMGSEPQIYFYAQRRSATGYIYTYALMEPQPNALRMQREMMREIETVQPEYLVFVSYGFSWIFRPGSDHSIIDWFDGYAGRYYDQVGIIKSDSSGKTEYLWDEAAKNTPKPAGEYIAVYKRKAEPATRFVRPGQPET